MADTLTDDTIQRLLLAVGAERTVSPSHYDMSFDDLDLDSLARTEFAVRIKEITGIDVEESVGPATTPNDVRQMVQDQLTDRTER
jgi:acyl carrier protein